MPNCYALYALRIHVSLCESVSLHPLCTCRRFSLTSYFVSLHIFSCLVACIALSPYMDFPLPMHGPYI